MASSAAAAKLTMVQAINLALQQALDHDDGVVLLGQDIGVNGGVFPLFQKGQGGFRLPQGKVKVPQSSVKEGLLFRIVDCLQLRSGDLEH